MNSGQSQGILQETNGNLVYYVNNVDSHVASQLREKLWENTATYWKDKKKDTKISKESFDSKFHV